jgi:hypothetical protein
MFDICPKGGNFLPHVLRMRWSTAGRVMRPGHLPHDPRAGMILAFLPMPETVR